MCPGVGRLDYHAGPGHGKQDGGKNSVRTHIQVVGEPTVRHAPVGSNLLDLFVFVERGFTERTLPI